MSSAQKVARFYEPRIATIPQMQPRAAGAGHSTVELRRVTLAPRGCIRCARELEPVDHRARGWQMTDGREGCTVESD